MTKNDQTQTILSVESDYSEAPENRIITISRIKDADCPFRYFKNYIETPKQKAPFLSIELGLGRLFHENAETLFRKIFSANREINISDGLDLYFLLNEFRLTFVSDGKIKEPYKIIKSDSCITDFEGRYINIASNFNKFIKKELVGHEIIAIEGKLQITTNSCFLRGKADLITKKANKFILWDWKSGREPNIRFISDFRNNKIQMGLYSTWLRYKYGLEEVIGSSVFLRDKIAWLSEIYGKKTENDVLKYMINWRQKLNQLLTYPQKRSKLCNWCPWKGECYDK